MKEQIEYYYNIEVDNLDISDNKYHFKNNNIDYFLVKYTRLKEELNDIISCVNFMLSKNISCGKIFTNINGYYLTTIDNIDYLLIGMDKILEEYDLIDIEKFNDKFVANNYQGKMFRNNWAKLWSIKNDYFEYQIRELGLDKKIVTNSFSYYLGLAENAIAIVNVVNKRYANINSKICLSHRRIFYPNYKLNYLNPLSFVFDLKVRDIAEYLKQIFFYDDPINTFIELETYLKISKLNVYECNMLYARLLYPTYYFDLYEDIMNNNKNEELLLKIISKVDEYEKFLKKAYLELSKYAPIEKIDWLIN